MRKLFFTSLLLLLAAPSLFAQDWRSRRYESYRDNAVDFTPYVGYRYGGTIFADQSSLFSRDVDVKSSANFGLNLGIPINSHGLKLELLVDRQNTNFTHDSGLFSPTGNLGDFHITYFQGGILFPFADSRSATPYVAVNLGVANLDPEINGVSASNRFSSSAAIGVKVPINRNLALRIEERGFFTSMQNDDRRCRSCSYNYNHDLYQGETNVGFSFKF